ncbi:mitochondrial carrier homolog 1-like isoform X2 [Micropterus dolomieu]|uniref:mitochondrial carrier homolog 1-like isoform X2 n=1 Tax=Micropterus dolomieu TaxID=147949 RepID=UPI001E8ECB90|nr:mitochondrial carrier homolog 1-like isoform X2 [Micropterus dolomieu]
METLSGQAAGAEPEVAPVPVEVDAAVFLLGAGVTAITHPLLYVKLLIQVGHEPLPPTVGTTMFGRRVLYLPGFFSYAHHIVKVDGKKGLFRGLSPRLVSSAISTVVRSKVKQQVELLSKKDEAQNSLRKVFRETSQEMIIQCLSRVATHPFHVMSVRCMAQFVGREVKYG